jgi:hypothetical protein
VATRTGLGQVNPGESPKSSQKTWTFVEDDKSIRLVPCPTIGDEEWLHDSLKLPASSEESLPVLYRLS